MPLGDAQRPLYEIKANLFKGLAHPHRIRVLEILSTSGETSVADMITETGLEASHLSQHLAVLRRYRLVHSERRANVVYYRLAFPEVSDLLRTARHLLFALLTDDQANGAAAAKLPLLSPLADGPEE
ncbi:MAG: metalloregulator ArsR/SmtB family transcription factor [Leucobacter sp.]